MGRSLKACELLEVQRLVFRRPQVVEGWVCTFLVGTKCALCKEGQWCPGLHESRCPQQDKEGTLSVLSAPVGSHLERWAQLPEVDVGLGTSLGWPCWDRGS